MAGASRVYRTGMPSIPSANQSFYSGKFPRNRASDGKINGTSSIYKIMDFFLIFNQWIITHTYVYIYIHI